MILSLYYNRIVGSAVYRQITYDPPHSNMGFFLSIRFSYAHFIRYIFAILRHGWTLKPNSLRPRIPILSKYENPLAKAI